MNVNSRSTSGKSPIFWPSCSGEEGIVRILINAGADPHIVDENREMAVTVARRHGHEKIVKMLEQSGELP